VFLAAIFLSILSTIAGLGMKNVDLRTVATKENVAEEDEDDA